MVGSEMEEELELGTGDEDVEDGAESDEMGEAENAVEFCDRVSPSETKGVDDDSIIDSVGRKILFRR